MQLWALSKMFEHFGEGGEPGAEAAGTRPSGPGEPGRANQDHQLLLKSKDPKAELIGEKHISCIKRDISFIANASNL